MKGDDLPRLTPPRVIFSGNSRSPRDASQEGAGAHRAFDLKIPEIVNQIKQAVFEGNAADILADIDRLPITPHKSHTTPSPKLLNTSEQLPIGAYPVAAVQPINRFTKAVFDERLFCDAAVPDADNDNFPDREVEAA
jgi:hypothetical protein